MTQRATAVTVGMFDGVHRGHRFVLDNLRRMADKMELTPAVVTFDRHPLQIIRPQDAPALITSVDERIKLIRDCGIDRIEVLEFDNAMRTLTAAQFAGQYLVPALNAHALLLGYDHAFGSDRQQGAAAFRKALNPFGIAVEQCPAFDGCTVSSSMIRSALGSGDIQTANSMLGHYFTLSGTVVGGRQLGRTIGFPTANIAVDPLRAVPANGVYAAIVSEGPETALSRPAMINIGTAPTVNGNEATRQIIEANIIGAGPNLNLYGSVMSFKFVERLRDERMFDSLDSLKEQLSADRRAAINATKTIQGCRCD